MMDDDDSIDNLLGDLGDGDDDEDAEVTHPQTALQHRQPRGNDDHDNNTNKMTIEEEGGGESGGNEETMDMTMGSQRQQLDSSPVHADHETIVLSSSSPPPPPLYRGEEEEVSLPAVSTLDSMLNSLEDQWCVDKMQSLDSISANTGSVEVSGRLESRRVDDDHDEDDHHVFDFDDSSTIRSMETSIRSLGSWTTTTTTPSSMHHHHHHYQEQVESTMTMTAAVAPDATPAGYQHHYAASTASATARAMSRSSPKPPMEKKMAGSINNGGQQKPRRRRNTDEIGSSHNANNMTYTAAAATATASVSSSSSGVGRTRQRQHQHSSNNSFDSQAIKQSPLVTTPRRISAATRKRLQQRNSTASSSLHGSSAHGSSGASSTTAAQQTPARQQRLSGGSSSSATTAAKARATTVQRRNHLHIDSPSCSSQHSKRSSISTSGKQQQQRQKERHRPKHIIDSPSCSSQHSKRSTMSNSYRGGSANSSIHSTSTTDPNHRRRTSRKDPVCVVAGEPAAARTKKSTKSMSSRSTSGQSVFDRLYNQSAAASSPASRKKRTSTNSNHGPGTTVSSANTEMNTRVVDNSTVSSRNKKREAASTASSILSPMWSPSHVKSSASMLKRRMEYVAPLDLALRRKRALEQAKQPKVRSSDNHDDHDYDRNGKGANGADTGTGGGGCYAATAGIGVVDSDTTSVNSHSCASRSRATSQSSTVNEGTSVFDRLYRNEQRPRTSGSRSEGKSRGRRGGSAMSGDGGSKGSAGSQRGSSFWRRQLLEKTSAAHIQACWRGYLVRAGKRRYGTSAKTAIPDSDNWVVPGQGRRRASLFKIASVRRIQKFTPSMPSSLSPSSVPSMARRVGGCAPSSSTELEAAIVVGRFMRMGLQRIHFLRMVYGTERIQSVWRMHVVVVQYSPWQRRRQDPRSTPDDDDSDTNNEGISDRRSTIRGTSFGRSDRAQRDSELTRTHPSSLGHKLEALKDHGDNSSPQKQGTSSGSSMETATCDSESTNPPLAGLQGIPPSLEQQEAAILLQSLVRCIIYRQMFRLFRTSSTRIQTFARCHRCRRAYRSVPKQATRLQAMVRGSSSRRRFLSFRMSIAKLQAQVRGMLARAFTTRLRDTLRAVIVGVIDIQRQWRGYAARVDYKTARSSAMVIQTSYRSLRDTYTRVRTHAAVAVQSHWRAYLPRRLYAGVRSDMALAARRRSPTTIQSLAPTTARSSILSPVSSGAAADGDGGEQPQPPGSSNYNYLRLRQQLIGSDYLWLWQKVRERDAATKVQCFWRVCIARDRLGSPGVGRGLDGSLSPAKVQYLERRKRRKEGAILVQRCWRKYRRRWGVEIGAPIATIPEMTERPNISARAAIKLQSCWRRCHAQRRYRDILRACCVIQSPARCVLVRSNDGFVLKLLHVQTETSAATIIQQFWNCYRTQLEYKNYRRCVILLQASGRGVLVRAGLRRVLRLQHDAATRIQSQYRLCSSRLVNACVAVQRYWRGHRARLLADMAATRIQSCFRIAIAKSNCSKLRLRNTESYYAATIQCSWRRYCALRWYIRVCQSSRGMLARSKFNRLRRRLVVELNAGRTLKRYMQSHVSRQRYLRMRRSAMLSQALIRGILARAACNHRRADLVLRHASATAIQRQYRRLASSLAYRRSREYTVVLQAWFRGLSLRSEILSQRGAALTIQCTWHGYLARSRRASILEEIAATRIQSSVRVVAAKSKLQRQLMKRGAVVIQSAWLGALACTRYHRARLSAIRIQSTARMRLTRSNFVGRIRLLEKTRLNAAVTVQRFWRGHKCSRSFQRFLSLTIFLQALCRGKLARVSLKRLGRFLELQDRAASAIQSLCRRFGSRTAFLRARTGTVMMQAHSRGVIARSRFLNKKRALHAALALQRYWHGHVARLRCERMRAGIAATVIQSFALCVRAKSTHARLQLESLHRCSAVCVQRSWRAFAARSSYRRARQSSCKIQAAGRAMLARSVHLCLLVERNAASIIQALCRGRVCRREHAQVRRCVVMLQSLARRLSARARIRKILKVRMNAASMIQSHYRRFACQNKYYRTLSGVVLKQALVRGVFGNVCHSAKLSSALEQRTQFLRPMDEAATLIQSRFRRARRHHKASLDNKDGARSLHPERNTAWNLQQYWFAYESRCGHRRVQRSVLLLQALVRGNLARRAISNKLEIRSRAATKIQSHHRQNVSRQLLRRYHDAVLAIQRWWHARQAKKVRANDMAATCIQSRFRGMMARRFSLQLRSMVLTSATTLQRCWRGRVHRSRYLHVCRSLLQIQAAARGKLARSIHAHRLVLQRNELDAAIRVERFWRGSRCRRGFSRGRQSVVKTQALWRGMLARSLSKRLHADLQIRHHMAARTIQSCFRRHVSRSVFIRNRAVIIMLQAQLRTFSARSIYGEKWRARDAAAVCIQRHWRGFISRMLFFVVRTEIAATLLQAALRGARARGLAGKLMVESRNATFLQSVWRGFRARRNFDLVLRTLPKFQAAVRGKLRRGKLLPLIRQARKETEATNAIKNCWLVYKRRQRLATLLQARARGRTARVVSTRLRGEFERSQLAATIIQRQWRVVSAQLAFRGGRAAAIVIQAWSRGLMARWQYRVAHAHKASVCLQAFARRILAGLYSIRRRRRLGEVYGATKLQCCWRRYQARLRYGRLREYSATMRIASTIIQCRWRMILSRSTFLRCQLCATTIQAWQRTRASRCCYAELLRRCAAAACIQKIWRGFVSRLLYSALKAEVAVTVLQSIVRGMLARSRCRRLLCELELRSALTIQSSWRGRRARLRHKTKTSAATAIQRVWRSRTAHLRAVSSAVLIQARCRCWIAKSRFLERLQLRFVAAVCVQRYWRGYIPRLLYNVLRLEIGAIAVQAVVRAKFARCRVDRMRQRRRLLESNSNTVVQCCWRRHRSRATALRPRKDRSATIIQSRWRTVSAKSSLLRARMSAIVLQAWLRGLIGRTNCAKEIQLRHAAAVCLQIHMSKFHVSCREKIAAATTIQGFVRGALSRSHVRLVRLRRRTSGSDSAKILQLFWRGCQVRLVASRLRQDAERAKSANIIQAWLRSRASRLFYLEVLQLRHAAAVGIQKHWRGYMACSLQTVPSVPRSLGGGRLCRASLVSVLTMQRFWRYSQARLRVARLRRDSERLMAVRILQCQWRLYSARVAFLRAQEAVVVIQAWHRGRTVSLPRLRVHTSAMRLQRVWRGYMARLLCAEVRLEVAAARIRGAICRYHFSQSRKRALEHSSAMILQCCWRGYKDRNESRVLRNYLENMSAVTIQAWLRGRAARIHSLEKRSAVLTAQAVVRGWLANTLSSKLRQHRSRSVGVLQRTWRGHQTRLRLFRPRQDTEMKVASTAIQRQWRLITARLAYHRARASSIILQAWLRGHTARRRHSEFRKDRCTAAVTVQKYWRRYMAGLVYAAVRADMTVVVLQAMVRGVLTRAWLTALRQQLHSALVLQSFWRRYKGVLQCDRLRKDRETALAARNIRGKRRLAASRLVGARETSAISIQAWIRRHATWKRLPVRDAAAVCVQRHWRGYTCRLVYMVVQADMAITMVQGIVRARLARSHVGSLRRHLLEHSSATLLQSSFRGCSARRRLADARLAAHTANIAATRLQAVVRGVFARSKLRQDAIFCNSVIILQSSWRACSARRRRDRIFMCISKIQFSVRSWLAQKKLVYQRKQARRSEAAAAIQVIVHRRMFVRHFQRVNVCARRIQVAYVSHRLQEMQLKLESSSILLKRGIQGKLSPHASVDALRKISHLVRSDPIGTYSRIMASSGADLVSTEIAWTHAQFAAKDSASVILQHAFRGYLQLRKCNQRHYGIPSALDGSAPHQFFGDMSHEHAGLNGKPNHRLEHVHCGRMIDLEQPIGPWLTTRSHSAAVSAAVCIQRHWRGCIPRVSSARHRAATAATRLQAVVRGVHVRSCNRLKRQQLRITSAIVIQSSWRIFAAFLRRTRCSSHMQAVVRGYLARKRGLHLIGQRQMEMRLKATITIQRYYRGHFSRHTHLPGLERHEKSHRLGAESGNTFLVVTKLQNLVRRKLARVARDKTKTASVCIQRHWRCYLQRTAFLRLKRAAIAIQSFIAESKEANRRQPKAESTFQGRCVHTLPERWKKISTAEKKITWCAIKIQSLLRGGLVRAALRHKNAASAYIQRRWRFHSLLKSHSSPRRATISGSERRHEFGFEPILLSEALCPQPSHLLEPMAVDDECRLSLSNGIQEQHNGQKSEQQLSRIQTAAAHIVQRAREIAERRVEQLLLILPNKNVEEDLVEFQGDETVVATNMRGRAHNSLCLNRYAHHVKEVRRAELLVRESNGTGAGSGMEQSSVI